MGRPPLIGNVPSFCYENGWLNCDFQHGYMRRAVEHGDMKSAAADMTQLSDEALELAIKNSRLERARIQAEAEQMAGSS
jgi:hypothetical protein